MLKPIFFAHNPKAGGTSIIRWLAKYFLPDKICPIIENNHAEHSLNAGRYEKYTGFDFYCGHYGVDIFRAVAPLSDLITNFRDPVSRIASLYNFFRCVVVMAPDALEREENFAIRLAKLCSFQEFIRSDDPRVLVYTNNHHYRQLTKSGWSLEGSGDLASAIDIVIELRWFYVCEMPKESLQFARQAFSRPDFTAIPRLNQTKEKIIPTVGHISRLDRGEILERNGLDAVLHQQAILILLSKVRTDARYRFRQIVKHAA